MSELDQLLNVLEQARVASEKKNANTNVLVEASPDYDITRNTITKSHALSHELICPQKRLVPQVKFSGASSVRFAALALGAMRVPLRQSDGVIGFGSDHSPITSERA